ncbi:MAG: hypothetical protein AB7N99_08275, partial [Simkaniaceae bacterium]
TLYQKRLYGEIIHFYEEDGGEYYIREYFGFSEEESIVARLSCIMKQIRASNPFFVGIGLMGVRILPAYKNALKAERLAKWKEMKGGHAYTQTTSKVGFGLARKLSEFVNLKRPHISNIRSLKIGKLRCFGATESPTFEVV